MSEQAIRDRMGELAAIAADWFRHKTAYSRADLDAVASVLTAVGSDPAIIPDPDGTVQVDWFTDKASVTAEFNPRTGVVRLDRVTFATGKSATKAISCPIGSWPPSLAEDIATFMRTGR